MAKSMAKTASRDKVPAQSAAIDAQKQPILPVQHVAIIMDGNRRWAASRGLPGLVGHKEGVGSLKKLVRHVGAAGLKYLTVYAFSSENWQRSRDEVNYLFDLFVKVLHDELTELAQNNVRLSFIGNLEQVPRKLIGKIDHAVESTRNNTGLSLQVAINYGSRKELTEAMKKISLDVLAGKIQPNLITEELINSYLYTGTLPDPELLIRTGGEMRLSNFLLWQSAYTELYVTDVLWPDFSPLDFDVAIAEFRARERRYGGD